jgi:iron complex transport system ATP-binding protein
VFPVTVEEVVGSGVFASGDCNRIEEAIGFCELGKLRDRELGSLSGGERQRVALARALVQGARVLFLDESLSKMDIDYQMELGGKLKELTRKGISVVLVSHDPHLSTRFADRAWVLQEGRLLADGVPSQVLTDELLARVFPRSNLASLFAQK